MCSFNLTAPVPDAVGTATFKQQRGAVVAWSHDEQASIPPVGASRLRWRRRLLSFAGTHVPPGRNADQESGSEARVGVRMASVCLRDATKGYSAHSSATAWGGVAAVRGRFATTRVGASMRRT